jgi:hypothetical protein
VPGWMRLAHGCLTGGYDEVTMPSTLPSASGTGAALIRCSASRVTISRNGVQGLDGRRVSYQALHGFFSVRPSPAWSRLAYGRQPEPLAALRCQLRLAVRLGLSKATLYLRYLR